MSNRTVARASVALGLALVIAGCGSSSPNASSAPAGGGTATASAAPASTSSPTSAAASPVASPSAAPTPASIVVAAASPEPALKQAWQIGGPKPPRDGACCVAVAPDGKIWVVASYDSKVWMIDRNGKFLESWGSSGSGNGQFNFVGNGGGYGAVAFDPDGTFYVADTGNHRVQKFDKNRHFVAAWGSFGTDDGQFANPADVATDGHGHVYVMDTDRRDVQEFSSDGAYVRTLAAGATVYFIATDAKGQLYVDDGPEILVFDADGHQLPGIDLSTAGGVASGMVIDAAGNLYVATIASYNTPITGDSIYELASGSILHAWPGDADSIALDPKGGAIYTSLYGEPFIRKLQLPKP